MIGLEEKLSLSHTLTFVIIFTLLVTCAPCLGNDAYTTDIAAAAALIEHGDYDQAVVEINNAFTERSGDPLAHLALGTVFLHTRQLDKAFKQFSIVHELSPNHPLAMYGFALYYLASGKQTEAATYFEKASAGGSYDTAPAAAYLSALAGRYYEGQSVNPVLRQIEAQGIYKNKDYKKAGVILDSLTGEWKGFEEEHGAVMTFDPKTPVTFTGRALAKPYKSPSQSEPKLKKVDGVVTLQADLTNAEGVSYVLFYVDDRMIGMINHQPYECQWDTTEFGNAPHTVKIEGHDVSGIVSSEKSLRVIVDNGSPSGANPLIKEEVKRVEGKLWDCLRLKPSRCLAYYELAKCKEAQKDKNAAALALERVVAIDPNYKDARALLIKAYSPIKKFREIYRADTRQKLAAISFDDGPNPGTGRILDVLAGKGVRATFFVVGGMAESNPDMLRRMSSDGHEIQNHTYSHRNLRYLSDVEIERELIRTAIIIRETTGKTSRYFRAPGGNQNGNLGASAGKLGYSAIFWTVNCAKNEGTTPDKIIKQVAKEAVPGSIILMHNLEEVTLAALPTVIDDLRAKGYKLVTLSELLSAR